MKNEKVTLVISAYIIGFTTAFIAFALTDSSASKNKIKISNSSPEVVAYANEIQSHGDVEILNKPEGLFILKDSKERVISAAATENMTGEGFHTEIFTSSVSPDDKYVHFCASLVGEDGVCTNFVYSVIDDLLYEVKIGGESLKLTHDEVTAVSWAKEDTLRFTEGWATAASNWSIR